MVFIDLCKPTFRITFHCPLSDVVLLLFFLFFLNWDNCLKQYLLKANACEFGSKFVPQPGYVTPICAFCLFNLTEKKDKKKSQSNVSGL